MNFAEHRDIEFLDPDAMRRTQDALLREQMRTILNSMAAKQGRKAMLEVVE